MAKKSNNQTKNETAPDAIQYMTRKEVARLLNRSLRRIDQYAQKGLLRRVKIAGQKTGIGFLVSDVRKLLKIENKRI